MQSYATPRRPDLSATRSDRGFRPTSDLAGSRVAPRGILRPLMSAMVAVTLLFVGFEMIERTWLGEADVDLIHHLHMARGLLASILAGVVALWLVTRASTPLHDDTLSSDAWERVARVESREHLASHVQWLIQLRWIAVAVAAILVLYAVSSGEIPLPAQIGLSTTIAFLAFCNLGYIALAKHRHLSRYLLLVQVYADLLLLTVFLHFSGGIENPLSAAMILYVIVVGVVLDHRQCYAVAAVGAAFFGLLVGAEAGGLLPHYAVEGFVSVVHERDFMQQHAAHLQEYVLHSVVAHTALLFLGAYLVNTLAGRIRNDERQLLLLADRSFTRQQMLEQALEATETGLGLFDPDLHPVWTNRRWQSWVASAPATVTDDSLPSLASAPIRETLQDGRARLVESAVATSQADANTARVFHVATAPLRDSDGRIAQAVAVVWEVTQQKQFQVRMAQAEKLAAVGELAGHVAHEVNNPIGILTAKARLLLGDHRGEMSKTVQLELEKIIGLGDRVAHIASGLLSCCRPSGAAQGPVDIRDPIHGAIAMVEHRTRKARIRIEPRLDESLPLVHGNAGELQQVFVNLLLNAIDAMPNGGELHLTAIRDPRRDDPGCVTVVLEDTGRGIAPEICDRVFEPFFTTKGEAKGTGLGLSVCAGLVESHGGEIDIAPRSPHGTRVRVTLPAAHPSSGGDDG